MKFIFIVTLVLTVPILARSVEYKPCFATSIDQIAARNGFAAQEHNYSCGLVCAANMVEAVAQRFNRELLTNSRERILKHVERLRDKGIDLDQRGLDVDEMASVIETVFENEGFSVELHGIVGALESKRYPRAKNSRIVIDHLNPLNEDEIMFLSVYAPTAGDSRRYHAFVLNSIKPQGDGRFLGELIDPVAPNRSFNVELKQHFKAEDGGIETLEVIFDENDFPLIEAMRISAVIRAKPALLPEP